MGFGLSSSMWSGVSGLLANSTKMTTIGDNLANVNTTGFKSSRVDFVTLMSSSVGTASGTDQIGNGVRVGTVMSDYSQGSLETTTSTTDMAVSGNGFFICRQKSQVASNGRVLNTGNATTYYTRAGDFSFDKDGYLTTSTGLAVQGWAVDQDKIDAADAAGTTLSTTPVTGSITDIKLDTYSSPAKATSSVTVVSNLDSDSETESSRDSTNYFYAMSQGWDGTKDPAMPSTAYSYSTTVPVYDENGSSHKLTVYYDLVDTEDGKQTWEYSVTCDPSEDGRVASDGTKLSETKEGGLLMVGTMTFDLSGDMENMSAYTLKGSTASAGSLTSNFDPSAWTMADVSAAGYPVFSANWKSSSNASFTDQGNAHEIALNLGMRDAAGFTSNAGDGTLNSVSASNSSGNLASFHVRTLKTNSTATTSYASSSSTVFTTQNGYTAGMLSGISVDSDGILYGTYSNGVTIALYAIALATFTNLQGLQSAGDNYYTATLDSGYATTNRANTGTAGTVSGNTLESSNVDLASEMVDMIVTQRGFEANSKTITTVDTMLSELIQLKR